MSAAPWVIVAGPTASGKSALAVALAERYDGWIINADSMQVYRDLGVLTARPGPEDEARVPHRLYGTLDGADPCSVARWLDMARAAVAEARAAGWLPILCGGTGLYLRAALQGLSPVPDVPETVRLEARRLLAEEGPRALHARLQVCDPRMAARLSPNDSQRLARAWEVVTATGRSLALWWADTATVPGIDGRAAVVVLDPSRQARRAACDTRLDAMVDRGVLDEVAALLARGLDPALPMMRTVGLPDLAAHVRGAVPLAVALDRAKAATRQYAKRQATWIRHQIRADLFIDPFPDGTPVAQHPERIVAEMDNFMQAFLLTGGP